MISMDRAQRILPWSLLFCREKTVHDQDVVRKIIKKTMPLRGPCAVLDIGCGNDHLLLEALQRNPQVRAVSLVQTEKTGLSGQSQQHIPGSIEYVGSDIWQLRCGPEFDLVYIFERLAHCPEHRRRELLQYGKMLLKPGGILATIAHRDSRHSGLRPPAVLALLQKAGYCRVRSQRLTATLQLLVAMRTDVRL